MLRFCRRSDGVHAVERIHRAAMKVFPGKMRTGRFHYAATVPAHEHCTLPFPSLHHSAVPHLVPGTWNRVPCVQCHVASLGGRSGDDPRMEILAGLFLYSGDLPH